MALEFTIYEIRWERYRKVSARPHAREWVNFQASRGLAANTIDAYAREGWSLASLISNGRAVCEKDSLIDGEATISNIEEEFASNGDSFGRMGSIPPLNSGDQNAQRRSQRVIVKVSVMVLAEEAGNKAVSEETLTVTVNAHGAMILLGLKVAIGQLLILRNSTTGEEVACKVVYVSPHQAEKRQIGVDFMDPCPRFWRISFPPADWTTQSPEAKGNTSPPTITRTNSKQKK